MMVSLLAYPLFVNRYVMRYRLEGMCFKVILFGRITLTKIPLEDIAEARVVYTFLHPGAYVVTNVYVNRPALRGVVLVRARKRNFFSVWISPDILLTPDNPDEFVQRFQEMKAQAHVQQAA